MELIWPLMFSFMLGTTGGSTPKNLSFWVAISGILWSIVLALLGILWSKLNRDITENKRMIETETRKLQDCNEKLKVELKQDLDQLTHELRESVKDLDHTDDAHFQDLHDHSVKLATFKNELLHIKADIEALGRSISTIGEDVKAIQSSNIEGFKNVLDKITQLMS